jgi:hypothetical protein
MADVQLDRKEQVTQEGVVRAQMPLAVWIVIGLLMAVMLATTGFAVTAILSDETPAPQVVSRIVPVPVDIAGAMAMKDESEAAAAVGSKPQAGPTTEEAKIDAANYALSIRSIGRQRLLESKNDPVETSGQSPQGLGSP